MPEMEGVVVIAGVGAILWGAILLLRGGILAGCLAVLFTGCCLGYPLFHLQVDPIPVTVDRILWVVLLGQCVVWRKFGWAASKPFGACDAVLASLMVVLGLSALGLGSEPGNTRAISKLVFFFIMPAGIYWAARQARLSPRAVVGLLASLTVFGAYLALTAIGERCDARWIVFPPYILSPEYPEFLGRARGPLLSPIGNGILFGACAAAALLLWTRLGRWGKAALTPVILLMLGGAYLTLTRSVWMGVGLGLMLVAALCTPAAWRKTLVAGSLLAAILVAATQWENLLSFKRDKALSAEEMAESARLRPILATVAWKMFLDRPLWGCGLGRYG